MFALADNPAVSGISGRFAARRLLEDTEYRASLQRRLISGTIPHPETLLHHCAYGKPKDTIEQAGPQQFTVR